MEITNPPTKPYDHILFSTDLELPKDLAQIISYRWNEKGHEGAAMFCQPRWNPSTQSHSILRLAILSPDLAQKVGEVLEKATRVYE